ncbi:PAS domain-containing protein, partial [Pseudoalteromonas nigrifaciens]
MKSKNNIHTLAHQYVVNDPLHQLFDAVNAISVQGYDEQRRVIYWNKGSEVLYGYTNVEATGKKLEDLIIPSDLREAVVAGHGNWINNGIEIPAAELTLRDKNNNDVSVFSSHVMFINQYGIKQMYCIDIDLTDVKQAQEQAMFREKMLETIFEAIPDLFFVMQEDGKILDYQASSSSSSNLYALPQQFIGSSMFDLLPDDVSSKFRKNISQALSQKQMVSFQYELTMPLGVVYFEARINHVSQYQQVMVIIRDITEQHKAEELIRKQAYYDNLTSLPNRFLALDRLSHMLFEAQRNKGHVAVLFIDLDNFKKVNDSFGHELGDKLLVKSAARLQQVIRKEDTI